jgi:hypothetical protein
MAVIKGQLFFAPGVPMKDLDFNDHESILTAFERRTHGLFLAPIAALEARGDIEEGALFGAALLVAALIESVARVDTGADDHGTLIKQWLETNVEAFRAQIVLGGGRGGGQKKETLATVFEYRFRNGLAHNGYIASLGRLSRDIEGPVHASGNVITVNPFSLARIVAAWFENLAADLRERRRDIRAFSYRIEELFREEVRLAKAEAAASHSSERQRQI